MLLLRLPATAVSAAVARHALAALEDSLLEPHVLEDAQLLVSELVTNSLKHAGLSETESVEVCLRASPQMVMVEVADHGRGLDGQRPRPVTPDVDFEAPEPVEGCGLLLVDRIAYRWGLVEDQGTRVWFELRRTDSVLGTTGDLLYRD
jgi:anti-sigma regulatory factor (Ser/Thr protein kinase)